MKKFLFLIPIFILFLIPEQTFAAEINVEGYYGLTKCTEVVNSTGSGAPQYYDCSYQGSQLVQGNSTNYTFLDKAVSDFSGTVYNFNSVTSLFLFAYFDFKKGNYYTLNYSYDVGSFIQTDLDSVEDKVAYSYFLSSDYVENDGLSDLTYTTSYDSLNYKGNVSITFKATEDTSSYRFVISKGDVLTKSLFRNTSFDYGNGVRFYLLNAIETEDNTSALLGQITNQNNTMINQNQQIIDNVEDVNKNIMDSDTSSSEDKFKQFFENAQAPDHGLTTVVTAPLVFIRNLLNHTCKPLTLKLPFVDTEVNLPCMKPIYQDNFGLFFNLYQTITTGVISYVVLIRIFATIKGLQDPQNDKIEVFNL